MTKGGMRGTKDRVERVKQRKSGQWSTVSSDLLFLASRLYKLSEKEAQTSKDGRSSKMVLAGIPLLLSSLTSLIIECESIGDEAVIHSFPDRGGLLQFFLTTFANFAPEGHR
jgi:hypothetical protein